MLICPVRGCGQALVRLGRVWRCERGHSFDVARSGYVNLLQPQDRRSREPGDSAEVVAARRRLHERGVTQPLYRGLADLTAARAGEAVVDAGCGEGFYLGQMAAESGCVGWGVDISIPAIEAAARKYPACQWMVANADRGLPVADATADVVLSVTGRMNAAEFGRVLRPGGRLIAAVASAEDLIELRGEGKDRVERTVAEFATAGFLLSEQRRVTTTVDLDADAVEDVARAIYRPRGERVSAMRVTFSLDVLRFARTGDR